MSFFEFQILIFILSPIGLGGNKDFYLVILETYSNVHHSSFRPWFRD